jgi:hypothetical protein
MTIPSGHKDIEILHVTASKNEKKLAFASGIQKIKD